MIEILLATILALQINVYRLESGLQAVPISPVVCEYSEKRLAEIKQDFSHAGFKQDFSDKKIDDYYGEAISSYFPNSILVLEAWKKSPKHNEILLDAFWDGICVRTDGNYWVFNALEVTSDVPEFPPKL